MRAESGAAAGVLGLLLGALLLTSRRFTPRDDGPFTYLWLLIPRPWGRKIAPVSSANAARPACAVAASRLAAIRRTLLLRSKSTPSARSRASLAGETGAMDPYAVA